jgi:predicted ATP-dependent endonuclease of OLD family
VLVGSNNSGKTSAMDALIFFLDREKYSGSSQSSSGQKTQQKDSTKTSKIAQLFKPANLTIFEW